MTLSAIGTFVWNFTEYLAYLCIIVQTGLAILGLTGAPQANNANLDGGLKQLISSITNVADKFVQGNVVPATNQKLE